ncbi:MAG: hypothetical protein COZ91_01625 [Candidatus Nealsonbacteria bacterium CG_4_8_14_3_um_filter_39_7]|uniref:Uncharacterized protein n=1 Tax=Candidatus Nealsonbacteria bacterium CG23_combo_of_CG06-09_8_20_14_all_39_17 TaxID=1974722 RepID=A0A2G9YUV3_9BACT|nr:MAG: hypothetical protein COX37_00870 [Candidatus Nealsonbacteria bacterium CG23_combo_of_CG06-09_8_20_14_all_39_17]PIU44033.1 MAG: hypothetical protein COS96_01125 [Candidatus Nealsonbacteria bacterium CG07_land_8_20_14_0_80_39_13]PIW91215.1 MAG: hypothetical protein COZ91_01625 [Candidatus Nealsonbacteria bacterium CG_4_8_14_3_um_filter_39_7]
MTIKKIKNIFKKIPEALAKKAFLAFLFLLFLTISSCGLIFYYYGFLADEEDVAGSEKPLVIDETNYQKVVSVWRDKEDKSKQADSEKYHNPFIKPASLVEILPK